MTAPSINPIDSTRNSESATQIGVQPGIDLQKTQHWLTAWFESRGKIDKQAKDHDALRTTNYFDAGWLTSMEVVEFITEIEQQFAMQFTDTDLQDSRFGSIEGLAQLIIEHTHHRAY